MSPPREGTPDMPAAVKRIVLDQQTINRRVAELACQISDDYGSEDLLIVGILEGARTFVQDLARHLPGALPPDFIQTTRYGRTDPSGEIQIVRDVGQEIASRHVLLVQSIVDTGLTLHYLMQTLAQRRPFSLCVCALLDRPALRLAQVPIRYVGFPVDDEFLVGYGMDYRESYGDLPFVATLELGDVHA